RFEIVGSDTELGRRKGDRVEEAAARHVDAIGRFWIGVEVVFGPPVCRRHRRDGIDAIANIRPEPAEAAGARKQTPHAENRQRLVGGQTKVLIAIVYWQTAVRRAGAVKPLLRAFTRPARRAGPAAKRDSPTPPPSAATPAPIPAGRR